MFDNWANDSLHIRLLKSSMVRPDSLLKGRMTLYLLRFRCFAYVELITDLLVCQTLILSPYAVCECSLVRSFKLEVGLLSENDNPKL